MRTHLAGTIAIDFLTVPTVTFSVLYVFFVLSLERRRILHVNVTAHAYTAWAAQQIVETVGPDANVVRLIRDRDGIYGAAFNGRVSLDGDAPVTREVEPREFGKVVALPRVGFDAREN